MRVASSEFADDPCSSVKRGTMVRAARALLSAVTRLLILADMADVMRLLAHLKIVEEALEAVKNATNEQDLANRFKEFGREMVKLNYVAARRQQELKDPQCRDEMAAARGALKKNATMLYTASQAFLRHPDVAATRANRDYVFKQVQEALSGVSGAAQAASPTDEKQGHAGIGELAAALNEFDVSTFPHPPSHVLCRPLLSDFGTALPPFSPAVQSTAAVLPLARLWAAWSSQTMQLLAFVHRLLATALLHCG
ncbi:hypothetical protein Z043_101752 [Scleropages formosus]|uniref:Catenin alpha-2 n=1 Tax=Scleropages formosus TaxID=113540 RepID=A0A0P7VXE5_SCLFO|nr:hypothetical protein Z043_101752 [Scleropages formosus]